MRPEFLTEGPLRGMISVLRSRADYAIDTYMSNSWARVKSMTCVGNASLDEAPENVGFVLIRSAGDASLPDCGSEFPCGNDRGKMPVEPAPDHETPGSRVEPWGTW